MATGGTTMRQTMARGSTAHGDGRHDDDDGQQGARQHGVGDGQPVDGNGRPVNSDGRNNENKGQQGDRWHDDGDGQHNDSTGQQGWRWRWAARRRAAKTKVTGDTMMVMGSRVTGGTAMVTHGRMMRHDEGNKRHNNTARHSRQAAQRRQGVPILVFWLTQNFNGSSSFGVAYLIW